MFASHSTHIIITLLCYNLSISVCGAFLAQCKLNAKGSFKGGAGKSLKKKKKSQFCKSQMWSLTGAFSDRVLYVIQTGIREGVVAEGSGSLMSVVAR